MRCTGIKDVGRKIIVLAINKVLCNDGFDCQPIGNNEWLMRKKITGQM